MASAPEEAHSELRKSISSGRATIVTARGLARADEPLNPAIFQHFMNCFAHVEVACTNLEDAYRRRERIREQRREREQELVDEGWRAYRKEQWWLVAGIFIIAGVAYVIAFATAYGALSDLGNDRFSPSDTAQVITAIGGLTTAVGLSIAGVLKALALLVHARADMVRARAGLPPTDPDSADPSPDG